MHTTKTISSSPLGYSFCARTRPGPPPRRATNFESYNTLRLLAREFEIYGLYFYRARHLGSDTELSSAYEALSAFGQAPIVQNTSRTFKNSGSSGITSAALDLRPLTQIGPTRQMSFSRLY